MTIETTYLISQVSIVKTLKINTSNQSIRIVLCFLHVQPAASPSQLCLYRFVCSSMFLFRHDLFTSIYRVLAVGGAITHSTLAWFLALIAAADPAEQ